MTHRLLSGQLQTTRSILSLERAICQHIPTFIKPWTSHDHSLTVNAIRLFVHILLQIRAVGPSGQGGNFGVLETIANRIDALFKDRLNIPLSSGGVLACYRESELEYPELVNAQPWENLGGLYHIELQGS